RILLPVVHAFQSLIVHGVPDRFPELRFGFIEATASWVPFVLYEIRRRLEKNKERPTSVLRSTMEIEEMAEDILKRNRMYVSFQVDEDVDYLLQHTGEDNLLVGSDYTHNDSAQEMDFLGLLKQRADKGDLSHAAVTKITQDNPSAFYGI
ncbi:MAG: amidohydrolase family protein, partial [Deltaproteobacteria bacterium]|nr:amidohydrolase family protein [Deltaproteobacteria bacterium]